MRPISLSILLLTMLAACKPDPALVEPVAEAAICFNRRDVVDRGPENPWGYDIQTPAYSFGFPACHPAHPDTLVYFMRFYEEDVATLRRELWWYHLGNGTGGRITSAPVRPMETDIAVSPGGWVVFSSNQGTAVIRIDGTGLAYLQDGTWRPRWHPLGDTLLLEEGIAYREAGQWIKKPSDITLGSRRTNSPKGDKVANLESGTPWRLYVEDIATGNRQYLSIPVHISPGGEIVWSRDQKYLYTLGSDTANEIPYYGLLFRINLETEAIDRIREFDGTGHYKRMDMTADGRYLITGQVHTDSVGNGIWYQKPELWIMDPGGCNERKLELPEG